jgi:hypothetical protein
MLHDNKDDQDEYHEVNALQEDDREPDDEGQLDGNQNRNGAGYEYENSDEKKRKSHQQDSNAQTSDEVSAALTVSSQ